MLIELHLLQNHAPSNLNRDDTNSPKEAFFGGHRRARISSQCLKRSIRKSPLFQEWIGGELAFRTKRLPTKVFEVLRAEYQMDEATADRLAALSADLGSSGKRDGETSEADSRDASESAAPADPQARPARGRPRKRGGAQASPTAADAASDPEAPQRPDRNLTGRSRDSSERSPETKQLIFLGRDDIRAVAHALVELHKTKGEDVFTTRPTDLENAIAEQIRRNRQDGRPIPVEVALFGRMTTSDAFEDVSAAVQVAHALSTNKLDHEFDFYTAVDDLKDARAGDDAGAGMIGDVEFNSSCYYKYFSIDWTSFLAAVRDPELARRALRGFVEAAALTTPTGKQNGFAAHNPPDLILVQCKPRRIPVSYANAFVRPVAPSHGRDLVANSIVALANYAADLARAYPIEARSSWLCTRSDKDIIEKLPGDRAESLDDLITRALRWTDGDSAPEEAAS